MLCALAAEISDRNNTKEFEAWCDNLVFVVFYHFLGCLTVLVCILS